MSEDHCRIGIVGCGAAAFTIHLPILQRLSEISKIVAVCDTRKDRAKLAAQQYNIPKWLSNIEEILSEKLDLIAILTGNHEILIEKALDAGIDVFSEKPISLNIDISRRLVARAKSLGLRLEVGLMRVHDAALKELMDNMDNQSVRSGIFYKYDGSDLEMRKALLPNFSEIYTFQEDPPLLPSGLSVQQTQVLKTLLWSGIHLLTTILIVFGKVQVVKSSASPNCSSISCLFESNQHQQIHFVLSETRVPVYLEEARLVSSTKIGSIRFPSPYLRSSQTEVSLLQKNGNFVETRYLINQESSFYYMWRSILQSFNEMESYNSLSPMAVKVEELARAVAENLKEIA